MEALFKYFSGLLSAAAAFFAPIAGLTVCALVFVGTDFVTGVIADCRRTIRCGRRWRFESRQAWRTVRKAGFLVTAIAMAWMMDVCILDSANMQTARLIAGFACGVELWSVLENASDITGSPLFMHLRRLMARDFDRDGCELKDRMKDEQK